MKFRVLKALERPGVLSADWKANIQNAFNKNPVLVQEDYKSLVQAIADLELIEKYLREQVLHEDDETSGLQSVVQKAVEVGALLAPLLSVFRIRGAEQFGAVVSGLQSLGIITQSNVSRHRPLMETTPLGAAPHEAKSH